MNRFAFLLSLASAALALVFVRFLLRLLASTCILKIVGITEVREALAERIRYLRVCSPAPGRHRKQKRCLPVCEVKRKQRSIGSRALMLLAAAGLAAGHLESSLLHLSE